MGERSCERRWVRTTYYVAEICVETPQAIELPAVTHLSLHQDQRSTSTPAAHPLRPPLACASRNSLAPLTISQPSSGSGPLRSSSLRCKTWLARGRCRSVLGGVGRRTVQYVHKARGCRASLCSHPRNEPTGPIPSKARKAYRVSPLVLNGTGCRDGIVAARALAVCTDLDLEPSLPPSTP